MPHKTSAINLKTVQLLVLTKFLFLSWWKIYWHTTYLKKIKSCKKLDVKIESEIFRCNLDNERH